MNKNIFKYDDMKRSEHMAVRNNVGWYFWTHQLMEVTEPSASSGRSVSSVFLHGFSGRKLFCVFSSASCGSSASCPRSPASGVHAAILSSISFTLSFLALFSAPH